MQSRLEILMSIQRKTGPCLTPGIDPDKICHFMQQDPQLVDAIDEAWMRFSQIYDLWGPELLHGERHAVRAMQEDVCNFYPEESLSPFLPLAAKGPWLVTAFGRVVYDTGGYGMLGFGHNPDFIQHHLQDSQVMANVMTASFSQKRLTTLLNKEIGHTRLNKTKPIFGKFAFLNSGSESMCFALRLADANAKRLQERNSDKYKKHQIVVQENSFHGRTMRAAQASSSSLPLYKEHLASFASYDGTIQVEPGNCQQLESIFEEAERNHIFIEAVLLEPVMGEGDPGRSIFPQFYETARCLTKRHNSLLIIDSIQAGFRATGMLSIIDYPNFERCEPPDIETFSKALNAGQYPLSVTALSEHTASLYKPGMYGNTMTANPRALDIAAAVLEHMTPNVRQNIRDKGALLLDKMQEIQFRSQGAISRVQGTGLLVSLRLNTDYCQVSGPSGSEEIIRQHGVNVIHGGHNTIRLTPYFGVTIDEISLIAETIEHSLQHSCLFSKSCSRKEQLIQEVTSGHAMQDPSIDIETYG